MDKPARDDVNWIETTNGRLAYPLNPKPEDMFIDDIAHSLSLQCRFTGHCSKFYSVAEHCVLGSRLCDSPRWMLLHDASEAYLTDIARPVKRLLPKVKEIENDLLWCVAARFNLIWPMPECVKITDDRMLITERNQIMPKSQHVWGIDKIGLEPYDIKIEYWTPEVAEAEFFKRFYELS